MTTPPPCLSFHSLHPHMLAVSLKQLIKDKAELFFLAWRDNLNHI